MLRAASGVAQQPADLCVAVSTTVAAHVAELLMISEIKNIGGVYTAILNKLGLALLHFSYCMLHTEPELFMGIICSQKHVGPVGEE